jgi:hypothetical protein
MATAWVPLAAFREGDLPPVCAKTGEPAQRWLLVKASALPSWALLPLLLLGVVPLLVALAVSPRVAGLVPLGVRADQRLRRARAVRWTLLAFAVAVVVAQGTRTLEVTVELAVVPLLAAVALYLVEVAWSVGGRLDRSLDGVVLTGVHPAFRSALATGDPAAELPGR